MSKVVKLVDSTELVINVITAAEIFTNPYDLIVTITPDDNGELTLRVTRGITHHHRLIWELRLPALRGRDAQVALIENFYKFLTEARRISCEEYSNHSDLIGAHLNPDNDKDDEEDLLTDELIEMIIGHLRKSYGLDTSIFRPGV